MTRNKLASLIANHEGQKSQVSIGDIREILRIIHALLKDEPIKVLKALLSD